VPQRFSRRAPRAHHGPGWRKRGRILLVLVFCATLTADHTRAKVGLMVQEAPAVDIMLVLDHSRSMSLLATPRLTRQVVAEVLRGGAPTDRVGVILFAHGAKLVVPLTAGTDPQLLQKAPGWQKRLTYREPRTNPALAFARALYELKHHGRSEAHKVVVLVTNGVVDVGDRYQDREKARWLKETLAEEGRQAGVRVFGLVFAETADVELLQTLGHTTGGDYYRVSTATDIPAIVRRIRDTVATPLLAPDPPRGAPTMSTAPETSAHAPSLPSDVLPALQLTVAEPVRGFLLWLALSAGATLALIMGILGGMLRQLYGIRQTLMAVPGAPPKARMPVSGAPDAGRVPGQAGEPSRPLAHGAQAVPAHAAVCVAHPLVHATEVCAVCQQPYCLLCLVVRDGHQVCRPCAGEGRIRLWFQARWTKFLSLFLA
jgi:Mg-chelatase subunit ChlD